MLEGSFWVCDPEWGINSLEGRARRPPPVLNFIPTRTAQLTTVFSMWAHSRLVEGTLAGQMECFELLLRKYEKPVYNVAYRLLGNCADASDVTQIAFVKAFRNLKSVDPEQKLFSWLYRIAINEALNLVRKNSRTQALSDDLVSSQPSPEDRMRQAELDEEVQKAMMQLTTDYRIVIVLRHFVECSYREMSRVLDIPEKTVKSRLFTARRQLRDALVRQGITDSF